MEMSKVYPDIKITKKIAVSAKIQGLMSFDSFHCKNAQTIRGYKNTHFCKSCALSVGCDINNKNFVKFYKERKSCKNCWGMFLDHLYLYIMWKLRDFIDKSNIQCCYCKGKIKGT